MKNRSKILSPRQSQIRREISDTAEYAATGFSSLCSSTKSKLQKVVSKLSGVCNSMIGLIFPKSEISVQQRDLYTFRLDSISNVIKNPLPGPKPFHSDSGTMPPTPGRFNLEEAEKPNKKLAFYSSESSKPVQDKPKYGIPLWKQFNKDSGQSSESKLKNLSDKKSPENFESVKASSESKNSTGKPAAAAEKVNPNSTPIGHHTKDNKPHVLVKVGSPKIKDSEKKISELDKTPRFFKCLQDVPSGIKSAGELSSQSSFYDVALEHKSEEKKIKDTELGEVGSKIEKVVNKPETKPEDKKVGVADEGVKEAKKTVGFFVPDNEKVMPEFEEGFLTSGSTSKSSSPSFKSMNPKAEPVLELKVVNKEENKPSSLQKPNPFALDENINLAETSNSKIANPFASISSENISKSQNEKDKDSTPSQEFVSRPHQASSYSYSNSFISPQNNPFAMNIKENTQASNAVNYNLNPQNNPFAAPLIAKNPFGLCSNSSLPLTPFPGKKESELNESIKTSNNPKEIASNIPNPFAQSNSNDSLTPYPNKGNLEPQCTNKPNDQFARSEPNPFNSNNPFINFQENKLANPIAQTNLFINPFGTVKADNKIDNSVNPIVNTNNAPQAVNYIAPGNAVQGLVQNPFAQSDKSSVNAPNSDLFSIGTVPPRIIVKGKRPNGP